MENKEKEKAIQMLEALRTDRSSLPRSNDQAFRADVGLSRERWIKNLMLSIVFIFICSFSITVYANYDRLNEPKQTAPTKPANVVSQATSASPPKEDEGQKNSQEVGEAFQLKFEKKIVRDLPKKKKITSSQRIYPSRRISTRTTKLSPPPQPKIQDKPALYDTPIQLPEDYKKRLQSTNVQPEKIKKKK